MHVVTVLSLLVVLCAAVHAINEDIMQPINVFLNPEPLLKSRWQRSLGAMPLGINQSPIEPWNEGMQTYVPDSNVDTYRHPLWGFRQPNAKTLQSNFYENNGAFDTGVYPTDATHRLKPEHDLLSKLLAVRMAAIQETENRRLLQQQQQQQQDQQQQQQQQDSQQQQQMTPSQNNVVVQIMGTANVYHVYPMQTPQTPSTANSTIAYKLNVPLILIHKPQINVSEDKANGSVVEIKVGDTDTKVSENETTVSGKESEVNDNDTAISENETTVSGKVSEVYDNDTTISDNDIKVSENETTVSGKESEVSDNDTTVVENDVTISKNNFEVPTTTEQSIKKIMTENYDWSNMNLRSISEESEILTNSPFEYDDE